MKLNLNIENMRMDDIGLAPDQERGLRTAIETELTRLIGTGGLPARFMETTAFGTLKAPSLRPDGGDATRAGRLIAQAIYRGIGNG